MIRFLWEFWKPYTAGTLAAVGLVIIYVLATLMLPDIMSDLVDIGIVENDNDYILRGGVQMIAWSAVGAIAMLALAWISARVSMGIGRDIREKLFSHITDLTVGGMKSFGSSTLITRTTNDVEQVERVVHATLHMTITAPLTFMGAAIMSFRSDARLAGIVLASIPVVLVVVWIILKIAMPHQTLMQERIDDLNDTTLEGIAGVRVIRAYNRESFMQRLFTKAARALKDTSVTAMRLVGLMGPATMLVVNASIVLIFWMGANLVDAQSLMVGDLLAVVQYSMQMLMAIMMLSVVFALTPRGAAAAERIAEVLKAPTEQDDAADHVLIKSSAPSQSGMEIVFQGTGFRYPDAQRPVLADLNFRIDPGMHVAIIGPTGSGKSTIVSLVMKYFPPTEGVIEVDGVDLAGLEPISYRDRIGLVPQTTNLFSGTIRENIAYGDPGVSDEEIIAVLKASAADDFLDGLDSGDALDQLVSRGGKNYSGGQRQRLAIARALARPADLYIFDDSTSALDFVTEARVRRSIRRHTADATTILITQRINVAMEADLILVIDEGRLESSGTHSQLMETSALYQELARTQLQGVSVCG